MSTTDVSSLPGSLRLIPSFPFVGRPRELALLRSLLPRAAGEGRRIALIAGEAGSGKSRLVREFAHDAAADGALVLHGGCDAVLRIPYQPVVEALEHLVRSLPVAGLREDLGSGGGELTRVIADLADRVGPLPAPVAGDPDSERHRLHQAVADLLVNASRRKPVVLVLDDVHWADSPTLLLLRHVSRAAAAGRLLMIATFRDGEPDLPQELSAALVDLRRSEGVVPIRLAGLEIDEIGELVEQAAGGSLGGERASVATAIHDLTRGNPFLVVEVCRALIETGALTVEDGWARLHRSPVELGSPEAVREVVSQRLARLGETTSKMLELAAVVGPEFDLALLRAAAGFDEAALLGAVDEALRSGTIAAVPERSLRYCFTHELVRRALYDRMPSLRAAELHLRVGEALESAAARSPRVQADLAHHFTHAAPLGGARRAVDHNRRAAEVATAALAFDEAVAPLRAALRLGVSDRREDADIRLDLGSACFRAGQSTGALQAYREAAEIARELSDGELLARAAIGFENTCWRMGAIDQGALGILEEAAGALDPADSSLRVMVLSGMARACAFLGEHERSGRLLRLAIETARRLEDRPALAVVLMRSYWASGTTGLGEVLEMLTEARDLAEQMGDIEVQAEAMEWRIPALIALGDLAAAHRELLVVHEMASRMGQPFMIHVAEHYRATIALCAGRLAEADAAAERSFEWGRLLSGRDTSGSYGIQMFGIRREQGRLAELAPVVRILASGDRREGAWRPALAAVLAELGMHEETCAELRAVRDRGLDQLRPALWIAALSYLADACAVVGDAEFAAELYARLAPHSGSIVTVGHGVACYGAVDRYLGMVAATMGEDDLAGDHFELALDVNRRMGADTWVAHTAYEYGRLLRRGGDGPGSRGGELLLEAGSLADRIGMPALKSRVLALAPDRVPSAAVAPDGLSPRELQILRLVAQGLSNREIGATLVISQHTAANHIRSILRKTGCANRTEAAAYAYSRGLTAAGRSG
jgi:DNA-binding CsgD family transcriptional regulator/tetratricopeptide (TPR) repeat protein/type II secretory pathway predicted ATPase ExeA